MWQEWHELLFAHWPLPPVALDGMLPEGLPLDTFDGEAWIGLVPFRMSQIHPRYLPSVPWLSAFPEMNVRTYIRTAGRSGVYFFSLDAANPLAVWLARTFFKLPYFNANMQTEQLADGTINYSSLRTDRRIRQGNLVGQYRPTSPIENAKPGSLEHWLTARYCLFTSDKQGNLYKGEIQHVDWPLQQAEAEFTENTVIQSHGIDIPDVDPLLHYSHHIEVVVWSLQPYLKNT